MKWLNLIVIKVFNEGVSRLERNDNKHIQAKFGTPSFVIASFNLRECMWIVKIYAYFNDQISLQSYVFLINISVFFSVDFDVKPKPNWRCSVSVDFVRPGFGLDWNRTDRSFAEHYTTYILSLKYCRKLRLMKQFRKYTTIGTDIRISDFNFHQRFLVMPTVRYILCTECWIFVMPKKCKLLLKLKIELE